MAFSEQFVIMAFCSLPVVPSLKLVTALYVAPREPHAALTPGAGEATL
jgi:hypothetical protein